MTTSSPRGSVGVKMAKANTAKASEQAASRDERGRWRKGVSPNAGGRPKKTQAFGVALQSYLLEGKDPDTGQARSERLLAELYGLATTATKESVRLAAIQEWLDRTIGKITQPYRFDAENLRQQAEALAEESGQPVDKIEPMLRTNLTLVK